MRDTQAAVTLLQVQGEKSGYGENRINSIRPMGLRDTATMEIQDNNEPSGNHH